MKHVLVLVFSILFLSGCITENSLTKTQPKGVKQIVQEPKLFNYLGSEITINLKSPMHVARDKAGNPIYDKAGNPVMEVDKDEDGNPILAGYWVKDQMVKQPTTWLDVVNKGLGFGVIYGLGGKALTVIQGMSELTAKDPMVVNQEKTKTDYVTVDGEGGIGIDRQP